MNAFVLHSKRFFLISILLLILFAAHPMEPLIPMQDKVWRALYALGIDVAMTPITSDMMLMWDEKTNARAYMSHFYLQITDTFGKEHQLPGAELDFYSLRIPILLMVDYQREGAPLDGFLDLICKNLSRKLGIRAKQWQVKNSANLSILIDAMKCP